MRRLIFAIVLLVLFSGPVGESAPTAPADLRPLVIDFERRHNPFVRKLFGCPPTGPLNDETCRASHATFSYGDFLAARHRAARLYSLDEE